MERLVDWSSDLKTAAILLSLFVINCGGSDVLTDDSFPDYERLTENSTECWEEEQRNLTAVTSSPTVNETVHGTSFNETGVKVSVERSRNYAGRMSRTLPSWLDATNCTLEAVMREMIRHGRLPTMPTPCQSQTFTSGRQATQRNRTFGTSGYSFSLSTQNRNATVLNATVQFPVRITATGSLPSSLRVAVEVRMYDARGTVYRGFSSKRYRRKRFPSQLCFHVSSDRVVRSLVGNGSGSLFTDIRVSRGGGGNGTDQSRGRAVECEVLPPFVTINAVQKPCLTRIIDVVSQDVT